MMHLFHNVSHMCSKVTTQTYSTSFASAIRLLHKDIQSPIYNIYGFVRFADEIVDTFHDFDKRSSLQEIRQAWGDCSMHLSRVQGCDILT